MTDDDLDLIRDALKVYRALCSRRCLDAETPREREAGMADRERADALLRRLAA